ncbi:MAG TPA: hypothetical protein VNT02_16120, partial [Burkholderiales bacterium]|nr:hypothetical protein [Burkholderiales bacterium]
MSATGTRELELRLLILAPLGRDADLIIQLLGRNGLNGVSCDDSTSLLRELERGAAGVIATEEALLGRESGLVDVLRRQPPWSDLPVMILTRTGADSPAAARAIATLGNVTLLERPVRVGALMSAARSAIRARNRQYEERAQLEALRASEMRLRALINASSYVVYRMNADWSELLTLDGRGMIADTERGNRGWLSDYIPPEDRPLVTRAIDEAIRTRSIFELEHRVRRV